jgi:predicted site-specific integrase-resolvase
MYTIFICDRARLIVWLLNGKIDWLGLASPTSRSSLNVELEIINHRDEQKYEEEITEDIIAIMTSYSARIYGKRGGRCKKL